jgi:hypothetical protein
MRLVPVEQVAANIRAIDDPVLRGKVQKALHMLHRTLELYRYSLSCQISLLYRIADIRAQALQVLVVRSSSVSNSSNCSSRCPC